VHPKQIFFIYYFLNTQEKTVVVMEVVVSMESHRKGSKTFICNASYFILGW